MARTTKSVTRPGFVVDHATAQLNGGRKIDWDSVPVSYENDAGDKVIPAGTPMADNANGMVPRADLAADGSGGEAFGLLASAADEGARSDALTGYGVIVGGVMYEDLLPVALTATYKTELDSNGNGFVWETYEDDR